MNYDTFVNWARENLTEEDISEINSIIYINKDWFYEELAETIFTVQGFYGDYAEDCETRSDYVLGYDYGFEKDYFCAWIYSCSDYPDTFEIICECKHIQAMITLWKKAVEKGWIDGEEGWEEQHCA